MIGGMANFNRPFGQVRRILRRRSDNFASKIIFTPPQDKLKKMKILFILPKIGSQAKWVVGIASLSAVLKQTGYEIELLEVEKKQDINKIIPFIKSYQPQVIGLSTNSHQYIYAVQIARMIKSEFDIPIFLGGVHAILKPNEVIQEKSFDGISIGEAEESFLKLLDQIKQNQDYINTNGFWFRKNNQIIKNNISCLIKNLDKLPFPDYSIFNYFKSAKENESEIVPRFIFSRGCPFDCTYCCNHIFKKIYADQGNYLRFRSVDKIIEEISLNRQKYNFKHFKIDDDTFSLNKDWVLEFCEKYPKKFNMTFECNVRPGAVDKKILQALKKAGCNLIKIGLENGNEILRKEILNRNTSNQEIIELFASAKMLGLKTFSFNMIGVPGETKKTIKQTIDLNAKIKPDFFHITAFYPYPKTLLGEKCLKKGWITKERLDSCMEESILELPNLTASEIKKAVKKFKYNVYKQYDWQKALKEKRKDFKRFIIKNPFLSELIKPVYRLLKKSTLQGE